MNPNLFIIGVQKSGTTSFHNWLGNHLEICVDSSLKDKHTVFSDDYKSIYQKAFEKCNARYYLDASVNYFYYHRFFIEKVSKSNKVIVFIRNPIQRAISAYKYNYMNGRDNRGLNNALDYDWRDTQDLQITHYNSNLTYVEHGLYYRRICDLKEKYGDNLKIFILEEIINDKNTFINEINSFLKIELHRDIPKDNISKNTKSYYLSMFINNENWLKENMKKIIGKDISKKIAMFVDKLNKTNDVSIKISDDLNRRLLSYYKSDIISLSKLLNRDLFKIWDISK
jgi:hypothetical protein